MDFKRFLRIGFYKYNYSAYKRMITKDEKFNASFRGKGEKLPFKLRHAWEFKAVKLYRKYQVNKDTIWRYYYKIRLNGLTKRTGIEFLGNTGIGEGLIIGHWGRIVVNSHAKFGNEIMLTHGVTIGRDLRGDRKGSPTFGNKVCIRTGSTVVGNITIGDDVLIAPNTFVNFDVPSHSVVIGNPASIHPKMDATKGHIGVLYE